MNRREFLRAGLGVSGAAVLGACGSGGAELVDPSGREVVAAEAKRATSGRVRSVILTPKVSTVDLGGPTVTTWTYGGALPGAEIRLQRGEVLEARLTNQLPADTSVHWHGLALRNDMDGMPSVTQPPIAGGAEFTYRFITDASGTYFFHPHSGLQLDRGLYAPLIIEDSNEPVGYDYDWVLVLDDWLDGVGGGSPDSVLAEVRSMPMSHGGGGAGDGMNMGAPTAPGTAPTAAPRRGQMLTGARSALLNGDPGDVAYPYYLINGRIATAPISFTAKPRQRARIRLINAGSDTAFRVALGGHRLRVTHTDGYPVVPVEIDTLVIGMGERYDVEVTLEDGVFPLVALAEGKGQTALALVRTGSGAAPSVGVRPAELEKPPLRYDQLRPTEAVVLANRKIDREHPLDLTVAPTGYEWRIGGETFESGGPLMVSQGERVRLSFTNKTMMWHPMHLHGHTFQINGSGPRKDTVAVLPGQTVTADFDAVNPGQWMVHCHNAYHQEAGMMRDLAYTR